jgi:hypothetical protein
MLLIIFQFAIDEKRNMVNHGNLQIFLSVFRYLYLVEEISSLLFRKTETILPFYCYRILKNSFFFFFNFLNEFQLQ